MTMLEAAFRMTGRSEMFQRLAGPLIADPSALASLGWTPTVTTAEGLAAPMQN